MSMISYGLLLITHFIRVSDKVSLLIKEPEISKKSERASEREKAIKIARERARERTRVRVVTQYRPKD